MRILKYLTLCLFVSFWAFAISGTIQAHTSRTIPVEHHPIIEQPIEIQTPAARVAEVPEVRFASFQDEFAVRSVIRNLTEEDKELLMQIAQAEAGNQDVIGRALVILTVLNRCEKNNATVRQTIFAPSQFYVSGMCPGDELTQEALELVMHGWDESEGCLYFCSTGWNYYGAEHLFKHQDHWFSK